MAIRASRKGVAHLSLANPTHFSFAVTKQPTISRSSHHSRSLRSVGFRPITARHQGGLHGEVRGTEEELTEESFRNAEESPETPAIDCPSEHTTSTLRIVIKY
ncbi:hypothetical protein CIPAW_01G041300 [Carya illinoinensis]|uniref:Uncharacterized protein n=1 Tax=Carya illinoinensis TaxID=32201 RepID=A0A8T1RJP7_CARIL|nr:hypothetical protein CIPAW_01G041300 [Carya illinoinensis]